MMQVRTSLSAVLLCVCASTILAYTPNYPRGELLPGNVVATRWGVMRDALIAAPQPVTPHGVMARARGIYIIGDININTGVPGHVRVLRSSGSPLLDQLAKETLVHWRFRPRSVYQLTVPIDFGGRHRG